MASMMEILEHCRLCLVKEQVNIPIFEELGDIRQIFLKITACLPVKVDREDNLPKKICDGCLYKLDLLYEFWNTATNAEKQLLSWLDAAGLESKAKIDEEIVVSPTEIVLKEEPITDLPNDISNDISIDISKEIKNDPPKDQNFMHQELPFEPVDFAYGTDTTYQDVPETITTATELVPSEGEPEPKRPRRAAVAAASAAAIAAAELANSESEEDVDDPADQAVTKTEDESEEEEEDEEEDENDEDPDMAEVEPAFVDVSQEANPDAQPGPSGIGKTGDAQHVHTCEECGKSFPQKKNLAIHKTVHNRKTYSCHICAKEYVHEANFIEHQQSCASIIQCKFCYKVFTTKYNYNSHLKLHTNESMFQCELCTASYTAKNKLREHIDSVHNGVKYSCPYCDKKFSRAGSVRGHMKSHDPIYVREKKYPCEICGMKFAENRKLTIHLRTHVKNRSYGGQICEESFVTGGDRIYQPELLHGRKMTYSCEMCPQSFLNLTFLNSHIKEDHCDV